MPKKVPRKPESYVGMASRRQKHKRRRLRRKTRKQRGGNPELTYTDPNDSGLKVFTTCDHMEPQLQALLDSLKKHKYSYEVLGFGKPWNGLQTKQVNYLEGMRRYKEEKGPDALAIFVDGYDVICIKDSDKLLATYKARQRKMPVVFGSEIVCIFNCNKDVLKWYDAHSMLGGKEAITAKLQDIGNGVKSERPVFLNTGFIMGPIGAIETIYTGISETPFEVDDQYTAGKYLVNNLDKFDLDVEEALVRNKLQTRDKLPDEDGVGGPAFLHFPGTQAERQQNMERFAQYT